ncbi:ATP-binding cassette domain-containing protein [Corynebacterium flavescens]|uniref:ATP-binding cassette domain-containing protein n=1 Tax=Corynebacterium flavescens TaxID=28028 RepID=UPI00289C632B|nr:ATP-binding cassette domain-containing protein [Corynebacterium flavescens]
MDLIPGHLVDVVVEHSESADARAQELAKQLATTAVVGADASAHISLLRETVREEVALGLEHHGVARVDMEQRVAAMLEKAGLSELADRDPARLSGGQTRRLACASVAITQPEILIVVEPYAGLDPYSRHKVAGLLAALPHTAVIVVRARHSPDEKQRERIAAGSAIELGEVSASRQAGRRRWWHLKPPTGTDFSVGPVHLKPRRGGVLWIRGANGSGKTTLLRAAAGLDGHPRTHPSLTMALQFPADQVVESRLADFIGDTDATDGDEHPLDLSASRLRLAQLQHVFSLQREVVILDEPDTMVDDFSGVHDLIHSALEAGTALIITCHDAAFMEAVGRYAEVAEIELSQPPHAA